jgi:hypothetical protein
MLPLDADDAWPISVSPYLHRGRNPIERRFGKINQCRPITMDYDILA